MPAVFVHGNPESAAIWDDLFAALHRKDVIALSPPGFGAPVPPGFDANADAYVSWLVAELERIDGPVDLVGHDWGGGHVMRVAMSRPDLIRSWATDIAGALDPDYEWHDMAKTWQTPIVGDAAVAMMVNAPRPLREAQFRSLGLGSAAPKVAEAVNAEMGRCILALYRSAAQPAMRNWGRDLEKAALRPGLVIVAAQDKYVGGEALARRSADRAGARLAVLPGVGHWWMCENPALGAATLDEFFASVE
ncbi:MAG: alpha/beta hydrolase [Acidobacteria bacterium]|nr:alpha/beta hydrolase [Acidobacteriota bacterium]